MIAKFRQLFLDPSVFRFALVGIANTLFGTGIMFLCYNLFLLDYWVSATANYVFGSVLSYFLNKYYTFKNQEKSFRQIIYFVLNITVCYLVSYWLAKQIIYLLFASLTRSVQENLALAVGAVGFIVLNYLGQRFLVFKRGE